MRLRKKKKPNKISIGKKGKIDKKLEIFLKKIRQKVDQSFQTALISNPSEMSLNLEKAFEEILNGKEERQIETVSFILGTLFGLSRWNFDIAKVQEVQEKKPSDEKISYIA